MKRYMQASAQIYGTLLNYISPEDIHVYSIDEYFIDITPYTNLYKKTSRQLAQLLLDAVLEATHIYATVGIGTNLFLAKIALDILAKHAPDFIGYLDESLLKSKFGIISPLQIFGKSAAVSPIVCVNLAPLICMASPKYRNINCIRNLV